MFSGIKEIAKSTFKEALDIIYPPVCLDCDQFHKSTSLICDRCLKRMADIEFPFCLNCREVMINSLICGHCGKDNSLPVFAFGNFAESLKKIIHRMKYSGYFKLGDEFARQLVKKYEKNFHKLDFDCLVPVPLHSYREKSRGFNQAAILAGEIGRIIDKPVILNSLVKIRRTRDQTKLNPQQREANIKGAFKIADDRLMNNKVVIVDDVITTGATAREAKRALNEANAELTALTVVAVAGL